VPAWSGTANVAKQRDGIRRGDLFINTTAPHLDSAAAAAAAAS